MRKTLRNLLIASTILFGGSSFNCEGHTHAFLIADNYVNPKIFYMAEKPKEDNSSIFTATMGAIIATTADNKDEAAIGAALVTAGTLESQREAARAGKAEINVNVTQNTSTAIADETKLPEYNLNLLNVFYDDGHLMKIEGKDIFGGSFGVINYKIDGLQQLFTFNRKLDKNGDGKYDFTEYLGGIKRNFRKNEPLEICLTLRGSLMNLSKKEKEEVTGKIEIGLFDEDDNLISSKKEEYVFSNANEEKSLFWNLKSLNLQPGYYKIKANFNDTYNSSKIKHKYNSDNETELMLRAGMKKSLSECFQIFN